MKKVLLTKMNMLISSLLAMLGFQSCGFGHVKYGTPDIAGKYGGPMTEFVVHGTVSNAQVGPLENIRISVKGADTSLGKDKTDANGSYLVEGYTTELFDSVTVVAEDYEEVYATDSVKVPFEEVTKADINLRKK